MNLHNILPPNHPDTFDEDGYVKDEYNPNKKITTITQAEYAAKISGLFKENSIQYLKNGCISIKLMTKDGIDRVWITIDTKTREIMKMERV